MNSTQITALIVILLYMAATVALGLIISQRKKAKAGKQSNEDFLMAGKSLGPLVLAGTLFAANTGGASTTGIATNVYSYGLSACWYVIAAGIGFVLGSFIAPYFRRSSASTVPEIISTSLPAIRWYREKTSDGTANPDTCPMWRGPFA